MVAVIDL